MACEAFIDYRPHRATLELIKLVNQVIDEYVPLGLRLTVRQLFYQFVARDWIKNTPQDYKRLADHVSNAREGGKIDWDAIEDRTRTVNFLYGWDGPAARIRSAVRSYRENVWEQQPYHVEVWIEKEALIGVIEDICASLRVPYCAHRGGASTSFVYEAGKRFAEILRQGRKPVVLHLADHDPTGVHMTKDLRTRFALYARQPVEVRRIALTMTQVRQYTPPANPAKEDDSRFDDYVAAFGTEDCWELDALRPNVLVDLVRTEVEALVDGTAWNAALRREERNRKLLDRVANHWPAVVKAVRGMK
jgi:hypothetical protein